MYVLPHHTPDVKFLKPGATEPGITSEEPGTASEDPGATYEPVAARCARAKARR